MLDGQLPEVLQQLSPFLQILGTQLPDFEPTESAIDNGRVRETERLGNVVSELPFGTGEELGKYELLLLGIFAERMQNAVQEALAVGRSLVRNRCKA